jgi:DNA replication protein DnaC
VLFAAAIDVVNRLSTAESNHQLARDIKRYQNPRIFLIDELGYLPLDKRGAELLFQVITKRYERGSIIITTNIAFKDWPRIFAGDATMTSALLDRLYTMPNQSLSQATATAVPSANSSSPPVHS